MTKKDYKLIAEILKRHYSELSSEFITDLMRMFKADNVNFSDDKFLNAIK